MNCHTIHCLCIIGCIATQQRAVYLQTGAQHLASRQRAYLSFGHRRTVEEDLMDIATLYGDSANGLIYSFGNRELLSIGEQP